VLAVSGLTACAWTTSPPGQLVSGGPTGSYVVSPLIHKIKHVIIVMQENRSFDSYFGTYPGADGIPMRNGIPTVCVPNPAGGCIRPYHDNNDVNGGGPHGLPNSIGDVNKGRMDGFVIQRDRARKQCSNPQDPACAPGGAPDVMGYHTAAEIPNYWTYARNFVLNDHMFEPVKSWSLPEHLYTVHGVGLVGQVPEPVAVELLQPDPRPVRRQPVRQRRQTGGPDRPVQD
jgi:phospholipase C